MLPYHADRSLDPMRPMLSHDDLCAVNPAHADDGREGGMLDHKGRAVLPLDINRVR